MSLDDWDRLFKLVAHHGEMSDTGHEVLVYGWEVSILDTLLFTESLDSRGNLWIVRVLNAWEKMMLNLIVQATVKEA